MRETKRNSAKKNKQKKMKGKKWNSPVKWSGWMFFKILMNATSIKTHLKHKDKEGALVG